MKWRLLSIILFFGIFSDAQKIYRYNLAELLKNNQLISDSSNHAKILTDKKHKNGISMQKIIWIKNVTFKNGTIDIDLRGKEVFLQSFLGIAFHGSEGDHYEVVYFRPFNFRHSDTSRRNWSVQYMVVPEFMYDTLRKEHPLVYEHKVNPAPKADQWFHVSIDIKDDWISVFVNHSATPSLMVKKLNKIAKGKIGLWDDGLSGDFDDLVIQE
jgi:hypothetical protein